MNPRVHRLVGIEPDNLLGFLALLGLLRCLEEARPEWRPRASWSVDEPPTRPMLHLADGSDAREVATGAGDGLGRLAADRTLPHGPAPCIRLRVYGCVHRAGGCTRVGRPDL